MTREIIETLRVCTDDDILCPACPRYDEDIGVPECFEKLMLEAADALEAALREQEEHRWIPVTERLPEESGNYIITACDEDCAAGEGIWYSTVVVLAEYYKGCWTWYENTTEYDLTGLVTHWMPLPEPPKEG